MVRNRLEVDSATGSEFAVGSGGDEEVIECGMVLGSIGYRCLPIDGVPYNERQSVVQNEGWVQQGVLDRFMVYGAILHDHVLLSSSRAVLR